MRVVTGNGRSALAGVRAHLEQTTISIIEGKKNNYKTRPSLSPHPESTKSNEGMVLLLYGAPPNPVLLYIASVNPLPLAAAAVQKLSKEVTTSIFQYFN